MKTNVFSFFIEAPRTWLNYGLWADKINPGQHLIPDLTLWTNTTGQMSLILPWQELLCCLWSLVVTDGQLPSCSVCDLFPRGPATVGEGYIRECCYYRLSPSHWAAAGRSEIRANLMEWLLSFRSLVKTNKNNSLKKTTKKEWKCTILEAQTVTGVSGTRA